MRRITNLRAMLRSGLGVLLLPVVASTVSAAELLPPLKKYADARVAEFDEISRDRKATLIEIAEYLRSQREAKSPVRMTFICTANSRRSQLGQAWAAVAAAHYGIAAVERF